MKQVFVLLAVLVVPLSSIARVDTGDKDAALKTVEEAYVLGIHTNRDTEAMRKGFHEGFIMFINSEEGLRQVTRDEWIARIDEGNKKEPNRPKRKIKGDLTLLDLNGKAAVVKVDLYRDGKHAYTDFMSLYKFEDGWKIVGKIFQGHK